MSADQNPTTRWQPIETAPKDRRILVYVPPDEYTRSDPTLGCITSGIFSAQWVEVTMGWQSGHAGYVDEYAVLVFPTKWAPLPDAPDEGVTNV